MNVRLGTNPPEFNAIRDISLDKGCTIGPNRESLAQASERGTIGYARTFIQLSDGVTQPLSSVSLQNATLQ